MAESNLVRFGLLHRYGRFRDDFVEVIIAKLHFVVDDAIPRSYDKYYARWSRVRVLTLIL